MSQFEEIRLEDGRSGFRKYLDHGTSNCFKTEAHSLLALAGTGTVATPEVIRVDDTQIVTRMLRPARANADAWSSLGSQLANMHLQPQACFGFDEDNYCGATPQPNPETDNGFQFFAEHRLLHQARMALDGGQLRCGDFDAIESICKQLQELVPDQAPALLHGDLWSGNVIFCADGPYLIDPACYRGWPEADLAMTTLFGRFNEAFYSAYQDLNPLPSGFEERIPVYNLYHLLNHLNIFGSSYRAEVIAILRRFS